MKTSKKKIIIILSVIAVLIVSALTILIFNNIKKERKLQEAIKLIEQQEKEAQELKEQQEQEEKERQEQEALAEYESKWSALGDNQQYLALGSDHLKRTPKSTDTSISGKLYDYTYSEEFVGTLFMIADQYFDGASKEDLDTVLNVALNELPDNATDREVYDALIKFTETFVDKEKVIFGLGEPALGNSSNQTASNTTSSNTNNNNNSNSNKNNNSSNSNNNNTSSSNEGTMEDFFNSGTTEDGWEVSDGSEIEIPVDPSGCEVGSAGWHAYWDGKTVKEHDQLGGICAFMASTSKGQFISYPDDYVIGSYGVIYPNYWDDGSDLMGEY